MGQEVQNFNMLWLQRCRWWTSCRRCWTTESEEVGDGFEGAGFQR